MHKRIRTALSLLVCAMMLLTQFAFALDDGNAEAGAEAADNAAAASEIENEEAAAEEETPEEPVVEEAAPEEKTEETTEEEAAPEEEAPEEPAEEEPEPAETGEEEIMPAFRGEAELDGVKVSVKAAEGVFPEGAELSVEKVSNDAQKKVDKAVDAAREDDLNVAAAYTFDVKILDKDGEEVQPADNKKAEVSFKLDEADDANLDAAIYHLEETKKGLRAEELRSDTAKDTVSAETDGFSYYTVEFTYGGMQYVMDGDTSVALADILSKVGLEGEVTAVKVSNADLFSAEKKDGKWMVMAHKAFTSKEWMKVTIGGVEYEIVVTDTVPTSVVTTEVTMYGEEVKNADFKIAAGGVVLGPNNAPNMATIRDCTVTNEASNSRKGGVDCTGSAFIAQKENNLLFDNVTINSSTKSLVLNIWGNASAKLNNSTLDGKGVEWGDVPFILNGAYGGDKGTLNVSGKSTIKNTKGAIAGGSGGSLINVNSGTLTLENSEIALKNGNRFVVKSGATLILDGTTLAAADSGDKPAITVEDGGKLILNNVTLEANNNITIQGGGEASLKGTITPKGKQQILVYGTLNLQDTTADLSDNGAIRWIRIEDGGTAKITNSKLSGSTSLGVIRANAGSTLNIKKSTFENNKANGSVEQVNGGVILAWNSDITITESTFTGNSAASAGGAIWASNCTLNVSDSTFNNNNSHGHGGAIYQSGGTATITASYFIENVAQDDLWAHGGAICSLGSGAQITIDGGSYFAKNKSHLGSAVIILGGATGYVYKAVFEENEITSHGGYASDGGALFVAEGSALYIPNVAIHDNSAPNGGAGLYVCGNGTAKVMPGAAAIYDNDGGDVMQRHYSGSHGSKTQIFDEALGGDQHTWTWTESGDGHNVLYATSDLASRPDDGGEKTKPMLLRAASGGDAKADVVLRNNKANSQGAGLGANGTVIIGDRTQIRIYKVWNDNSNASGKRLIDDDFVAQLTVKDKDGEKVDLSADGIEVTVHKSGEYDAFTEVVEAAKAGRTEKVTASEDNWVIDITGLPEEGWPYIVYEGSRPDSPVSDYYLPPADTNPATDSSSGFFGFKNTYAEGKATIEGNKILKYRTLRKGEFEFVLQNDKGEEVGRAACDEKGRFAFDITYTLKDYLDAKEKEYTYTYSILEVQGKDSTVIYDTHKSEVAVKLSYTYGEKEIKTEVIYKDEKSPEFVNEARGIVRVTKVWDDGDDSAGIRPDSVEVRLLANGKDTGKKITLNKDDYWKGSFENLDIVDAEGKEIRYSVEEVTEGNSNLSYYASSVTGDAASGFIITNKLEVHTASETGGTKTWKGDDDVLDRRPSEIKVKLLADGKVFKTVTVSEADDWKIEFGDIPEYRDGKKIKYTIEEVEVEGYEASYDGFDITNTYTGAKPDEADTNGSKSGSKGAYTGDNSPVAALIVLIAACTAGIAGIAVRRRKKNEE